jgi:hypothetical protein
LNELQTLPVRSTVSSLVSEFMCACLTKELGFDVYFNPAGESKSCDLLVCSFKTEIKTFLDSFSAGAKLEDSLVNEIRHTLRRKKAVCDINDSLSKRAEIVFMFLSFSSLGAGFAKYTYKSINTPVLSIQINECLHLAVENRRHNPLDEIPILVISTLIDSINCNFKIFFQFVPCPVKKKNNNE